MNVYQSERVSQLESSMFPRTTSHTVVCTSAKSVDGYQILQMTFGEGQHGPDLIGYSLVGQDLMSSFINEMNVDSIDQLVGREVEVVISRDKMPQGLIVKDTLQ